MYYRTNELYHHGIKGMKWGVRRFQNEDGTLTPAGKKRYGYIHDAGRMAQEASRIANEKADWQKQINKGMKERYSGNDAWKTYAKDVFGTTTGKEYGMDRKAFESNMRNQLKGTLEEIDQHDKAVIEAYSAVGERYAKASKLLLETPISTLTKSDMKTAKEFYNMFMANSSEDLVEELFVQEMDNH